MGDSLGTLICPTERIPHPLPESSLLFSGPLEDAFPLAVFSPGILPGFLILCHRHYQLNLYNANYIFSGSTFSSGCKAALTASIDCDSALQILSMCIVERWTSSQASVHNMQCRLVFFSSQCRTGMSIWLLTSDFRKYISSYLSSRLRHLLLQCDVPKQWSFVLPR
jgi:hypothetical protein